jgi:hypothetical protein
MSLMIIFIRNYKYTTQLTNSNLTKLNWKQDHTTLIHHQPTMTMTQPPQREEDEELQLLEEEEEEEEDLQVIPDTTSSRCSSGCRRRYPRLFSQFFWIYLLLEGLCFVTDIAFLSSTIMAARRNAGVNVNGDSVNTIDTINTVKSVHSGLRGRLLEDAQDDDDDDDDNDHNQSILLQVLHPPVPSAVQSSVETVPEEIPMDALDWKTFQALFLQQLKLQWQQQQAFFDQFLPLTITATITTPATPATTTTTTATTTP